MKFGLVPINIGVTDADALIELAVRAEAAGYESLWTFEHVIVPIDYQSKYPYSNSGKMGADPETPFIDPLIALTLIAGHTHKIRLATGVNILSQANPLYLAKQAASIDVLSSGRLELGLGIGWLREEFAAMGVPFERRGARFDDYVQAMRKVWSGEVVEHSSDFIDWSGFKSYPLPQQTRGDAPSVPIVMGGNKGRIFKRTAALGDGWFAPSPKPEEIASARVELARECEALGRDVNEIEITCMWPGRGGREAIDAFAAAGVSRLVVPLQALGASPVEGLEQLADEIIEAA
ncbi:MAG: LLM class F420-dependent oxidoreductase [Pseudomonadota bacterium]